MAKESETAMSERTIKGLIEEWEANPGAKGSNAVQLENYLIAWDRETQRMIDSATSARKIDLLHWFREQILGL